MQFNFNIYTVKHKVKGFISLYQTCQRERILPSLFLLINDISTVTVSETEQSICHPIYKYSIILLSDSNTKSGLISEAARSRSLVSPESTRILVTPFLKPVAISV